MHLHRYFSTLKFEHKRAQFEHCFSKIYEFSTPKLAWGRRRRKKALKHKLLVPQMPPDIVVALLKCLDKKFSSPKKYFFPRLKFGFSRKSEKVNFSGKNLEFSNHYSKSLQIACKHFLWYPGQVKKNVYRDCKTRYTTFLEDTFRFFQIFGKLGPKRPTRMTVPINIWPHNFL